MKSKTILLKLTLFVVLGFNCCSTDNTESGVLQSDEDYLSINGDSRVLKNQTSDSDLKIEKFIEQIPKHNLYDLDEDVVVIGVDIYDPNRSLISGFGNYNIIGDYVLVRFVLPLDFEAGEYTTINQRIVPTGYKTFGSFTIQDEFSFISDENHKIQITEFAGEFVLEFRNVIYQEGQATLSGKLTIKKV